MTGLVAFEQFLDLSPVFRIILLKETGSAKGSSGAIFKRCFGFRRGGLVGNAKRPNLNLIWPTGVPDTHSGGAIEPGKRRENIVMPR
ncbi:hypothetical protein D3C71_1935850 [compost metagenome]